MSFHISSSSKLKTCNETPWFGFEFYQTLDYLQNRERGVFGVEIVATWPTSVWHKSWKQMERNTLRSFWTNTRDQFREIQHLGERGDFRGGIVATFTTAVWQWQQQQVRTNPSSAARTQTGFCNDDITSQEWVCMSISLLPKLLGTSGLKIHQKLAQGKKRSFRRNLFLATDCPIRGEGGTPFSVKKLPLSFQERPRGWGVPL